MSYQTLVSPRAEGSIVNADVVCTKCTERLREHHTFPTESRPFSDDLLPVGRYRTNECSVNPDRSND